MQLSHTSMLQCVLVCEFFYTFSLIKATRTISLRTIKGRNSQPSCLSRYLVLDGVASASVVVGASTVLVFVPMFAQVHSGHPCGWAILGNFETTRLVLPKPFCSSQVWSRHFFCEPASIIAYGPVSHSRPHRTQPQHIFCFSLLS